MNYQERNIKYVILLIIMLCNMLMADDIELIGHFSCDSCYSIDINENTLFVGSGKNLIIIDISDPAAPFELSRCSLLDVASGIAAQDTLIYVMDTKGTLNIISVANINYPELKGTIDLGVGYICGDEAIFPLNAPDLCVENNLAYIVNGWGCSIVNVENSKNPSLIGSKRSQSFSLGVDVCLNYAFIADWHKGLDILDISDPLNPVLVGNYTPPVPSLYDPDGYAYKVKVNDNYAYVCDSYAGVGLRILDISQKNNPVQLSQFNLISGYANNIAMDERYVYLTFNNGIRIIDVINPSSPEIITYFSLNNLLDICVNDTLIFSSNRDFGAYIFRKPTITKRIDIPEKLTISQNYPNPFNPVTTIHYENPHPQHVRIQIFNLEGRLISTLVDKYSEAGSYSVKWDAGNLSSGIYIYRLQSDDELISQKMVLIK